MQNLSSWSAILVAAVSGSFLAGCKQAQPELGPITVRYQRISSADALKAVLYDKKLEEMDEPSNDQTIKWLDTQLPKDLSKYGAGYSGFVEAIHDCQTGSLQRPHSFMGLTANEHDHVYAATYQVLASKYSSNALSEDISNAHSFASAAGIPEKDSVLGYCVLARIKNNFFGSGKVLRDLQLKCYQAHPQNLVAIKECASICESGSPDQMDGLHRLIPVEDNAQDLSTAISMRRKVMKLSPTDGLNAVYLFQDLKRSGHPDQSRREARAFLATLPNTMAKVGKYDIRERITSQIEDQDLSLATELDGHRKAIVYAFPSGGKSATDYLVSYISAKGKVLPPEHYKSSSSGN